MSPRSRGSQDAESRTLCFRLTSTGTFAPWFRYFYPREHEVHGYPVDPRAQADHARRAATALGLEVFGGDAIVTPRGPILLIDLNAWPSFALYRDEAAAEIASYLEDRFTSG